MNRFGWKFLIFFFGGMIAVLCQAQSEAPSPTPEQMKQWKREHERTLQEKHNVEKQRNLIIKRERGVLRKLQQIESELAANEKELARHREEIAHQRLKAEELQAELKKLYAQDKRYKKLVAERIRAIYKLGYNGHQLHTLKRLLGAQNLRDLLHKYKYMSFIAEADQNVLDQLQVQQEDIQGTRLALIQRIQMMEAASRAAQAKGERILAQKREREKLRYQYRTQNAIYNQTLKELKVAVAQLEDLLGIVSEERITERAQAIESIRANMQGKLPWPVVGTVVPNQTAIDRGVTIQAEKGVLVRCVADGVVARTVESIVGYGNTILITHGNGYISVYAHLSDTLVKPGDVVQAKQMIGKVGETGSLIGEVLYFELWHNYDRLNTQKWLMKRK
ncbi:MAG: peptidoglycan DD-metalloendopeptidase family protein [Candidatus Poribacteria bacterium]|nr:peptidoglycan DD-metalloendopeptidase family protein [Candidatus Poribacteria bacterium]